MDKQRYYVSVQSRTLMNHQGDAAYEFEIDATPEDAQQLIDLFASLEDFDESTFFRNHIPGIPYHDDVESDGYDYYLKQIYGFIHQFGTEETKNHIATMNLQLGAKYE